MEKNKKITSTSACEKCEMQSKLIQKYSEEIVDLQRQVSALSARLLKYETDPPTQVFCVVKMENKSDEESDDHNSIQNDDAIDIKDVAEFNSDTSRDDFQDNEYDTEEANPDEEEEESEEEVKKEVRTKKSSARKMRKCKTCDEEFSSSRGLLRHNHEIHGRDMTGWCLHSLRIIIFLFLLPFPFR